MITKVTIEVIFKKPEEESFAREFERQNSTGDAKGSVTFIRYESNSEIWFRAIVSSNEPLEEAPKSDKKYCLNCVYSDLHGYDYPCSVCFTSARRSYFKDKVDERIACITCAYKDRPMRFEPCFSCGDDYNKWKRRR